MKFKIILNEQTPKIENYKELHNFLKEDYQMLCKFISFARTRHNIAGLASNQVSLDGKRIMEPFFLIFINNAWEIIIHPLINKYSGEKVEMIEGCLTWLGKRIVVDRFYNLSVTYYSLKGEKIQKDVHGIEAQIWQHEYNHLMGIEEKIIERDLLHKK